MAFPKLIKLTRPDSKPFWIAVEMVVSLTDAGSLGPDGTRTEVGHLGGFSLFVRETPEEVIRLIARLE